MKPSAQIILRALRRGEVLTQLTSVNRFGVLALSQRIGEIKRDPEVTEEIVSERVVNDVYHRYFMPKHCKVVSTPTAPNTTHVRAHVRITGASHIVDGQGDLFT